MKKIRNKIFETNSSSMHSFLFSREEKEQECYTPEELKKLLFSDDGLIHLYFDEYGWSGPDLRDVKEKMAYCVFQLLILHTRFHTWNMPYEVCEMINEVGLEKIIDAFSFEEFKKSLVDLCNKLGVLEGVDEYHILDNFKFNFGEYSNIDHQSVGDFDVDYMVKVISRKDGYIEISNDN